MFDVLGSCRLQWVELAIDRDLYCPALEAITGIKRSWQDLELVGERIWNLTRMFWDREIEDFGRIWDMPAPRFFSDPPTSGVTAGKITSMADINRLLDMYYEKRGWSKDGIPTSETLERLGLAEIVS
jgi:aldehyde:ferredoxin oxidoreductase